MTKFAKIILTIIVLIIIAVGAFMYATRDVAAPSIDLTAHPATSTSDTTNAISIASSSPEDIQAYRLSNSVAEFNIDEVLNGKPKTVVGTTSQVAGTVSVNTNSPELSSVGTIRINARTFLTDSDRRDSAIARFILKSEIAENEFIEFKPTSVTELKVRSTEPRTPGAVSGTIRGDLTIAGITKPATFNVTADTQADGSIKVLASATIKRGDFSLVIPSVPFVANVGESVTLKFNTTLIK